MVLERDTLVRYESFDYSQIISFSYFHQFQQLIVDRISPGRPQAAIFGLLLTSDSVSKGNVFSLFSSTFGLFLSLCRGNKWVQCKKWSQREVSENEDDLREQSVYFWSCGPLGHKYFRFFFLRSSLAHYLFLGCPWTTHQSVFLHEFGLIKTFTRLWFSKAWLT